MSPVTAFELFLQGLICGASIVGLNSVLQENDAVASVIYTITIMLTILFAFIFYWGDRKK